jgi:acyl-CoA thioesterase-1
MLLRWIVLLSLWAVPALAAHRIVYLGDSVTAGFGIDDKKAYPWIVHDQLRKKRLDIETVNASVSGSLSSSAVGRVKWILKSKPDVLVLALGGNDGLKGTPVSEIEKNLRQAIELAQKERVVVVLAGFKMFTNLGATYTRDFELVYTTLSKIDGVILIPFLLEGVGAVPELNLADGKHPNEKGHQKIATVASPFIAKAVQRASQSRENQKKLSAK